MKFLFLFIFAFTYNSFAQKRPLSHSDYDSWNSISETKISNNGYWVVYSLLPQDGDSKMVFYPLLGNAIDTVFRASDLKLSQDSEWAVFKISASKAQMKKANLAKKKKEDLPKDSLGIYQINKHELEKIPNVKSFVFPENTNAYVSMLLNPEKELKKDTSTLAKKKKRKIESEENGSKLLLFNFLTKQQRTFPFVNQYQMDKAGKLLVFSTSGNDSTFLSGIYAFDLNSGNLKNILRLKGNFKSINVSDDGTQWAIVLDPDTTKKALAKNHQLWYWKSDMASAELVADSTKIPNNLKWKVSGDYVPNFSKDGSKLFFGTYPQALLKDTTRLDDEIVSLDVWNWQDKKLMPQQLANLKNDLKKSFLAVFSTSNKRIVQLASPDIPQIVQSKDANEDVVLGVSDEKYSSQHWLFNPPSDIYTISTKDGQVTRIFENARISNLSISPEGKYVVWYAIQDTAWYCYQIKNNKTLKLTSSNSFSNFTDNDEPDYPQSYGMAGWTKEDDKILIYDKYDIWAFDPNKSSDFKKLTSGAVNKRRYRYIQTEEKETAIDIRKALLLHIFDETTKASGYATYTDFFENKITSLVLDNFDFSSKVWKAKDASELVFTKESFETFPDLQTSSGFDFKEIRKISNANQQQKNRVWGKAELIKWRNLEGIELEGILYKPENFDSTKKYPMITYFYEKISDELHSYIVPQPARASINFSYYASNGYVIFVPNIIYKKGYPGQSAYDCIMSGIVKVLEGNFIDKNKLGIQGHSWGGYQTAYLITKTDIFAAAEAGAPVANMISAYGGIRWDTGNSRQAQYELTQSRIGATLWEKPMIYIENSPLFYLPNIKTPLLMMHNDADGAVPWYQGIELFMGLKRLNKPVWMINYNGEKHGLTQRKNRVDWTIRMSQYFDHYLKNQPAPEWLKKGVPATQKTLNYGLKLND